MMLKRTLNFVFSCLIVSVFVFTNGCSGSSSSGSGNDTIFLESGVKYIYLKKGESDAPKVDSLMHVTTHINLMVGADTVWSTHSPGQKKFEFDAQKTSLIKGFDEVVMHVRKGDRILAIIPPELGYGPNDNGPIPGNSTLRFDIDFLNVEKPKISLSEELYAVYKKDGIEGMLDHYKSLTLDTAEYIMGKEEWYALSDKMMREGAFDKAIAMWDFRLEEVVDDLGGHYMKAQACQNLGQIDVAVATLEKGLKVAKDTVGIQFIKRYLTQLKALNN